MCITIKHMKLSHPAIVASFATVTDEPITVWRKREPHERTIGSMVVPRHDGGVDLWVKSNSDPERADYYEMVSAGDRWCFAPDYTSFLLSEVNDNFSYKPNRYLAQRARIWER